MKYKEEIEPGVEINQSASSLAGMTGSRIAYRTRHTNLDEKPGQIAGLTWHMK